MGEGGKEAWMGEGGKEAGMEGGKEHDREPFQRQFHKCRSQVQTPGDRLRFGQGAAKKRARIDFAANSYI